MRVSINPDDCTGCGLCVDSVPDVFEMGDDTAQVITPKVPPNLEADVQEAAENCPTSAIIVEK